MVALISRSTTVLNSTEGSPWGCLASTSAPSAECVKDTLHRVESLRVALRSRRHVQDVVQEESLRHRRSPTGDLFPRSGGCRVGLDVDRIEDFDGSARFGHPMPSGHQGSSAAARSDRLLAEGPPRCRRLSCCTSDCRAGIEGRCATQTWPQRQQMLQELQ